MIKSKISLLFAFWLFLCQHNFVFSQSGNTHLLSVTPAYEMIFSQVEISAGSLKINYGVYNNLRFYLSGGASISYGQNAIDKYGRVSKFERISPNIGMKWLMLGRNKYMSFLTWENTRLCFDAGLTFHLSNSSLYYNDKLFRKKTIFYPSVDFGGSLLIPFGYVAKHRNTFLNRSDLYLEITESLLIKKDVSLIVSAASIIDDITFASRIGLGWYYIFK